MMRMLAAILMLSEEDSVFGNEVGASNYDVIHPFWGISFNMGLHSTLCWFFEILCFCWNSVARVCMRHLNCRVEIITSLICCFHSRRLAAFHSRRDVLELT